MLKSTLRHVRRTYRQTQRSAMSSFVDRWMYDQFIPIQSLNRTQLDYDVTYYGEHEVYFPDAPKGSDIDQYRELRLHHHPVALPRPYHFRVEDAVIYRGEIVDLANPKRVFLENYPEVTQFVEGSNHKVDVPARRTAERRGPELAPRHDDVYWFSSRAWKNYYHFIVDCCLRFVDLDAVGALTDRTTILCHREPTKWQRMYLELLGVGDDRLAVCNNDMTRVNNLLISASRRQRFAISPQAIASFNTRIRAGVDLTGAPTHDKFYISRSMTKLRQVTNEDALSTFLKERGFQVIHLENMSAVEQIALFSNAKTIVAPHGAGLTNLIYANAPNVVELIPADFWGWGYFIPLTHAVGGKHWPIVGTDRDDFHVDIAAVERALSQIDS